MREGWSEVLELYSDDELLALVELNTPELHKKLMRQLMGEDIHKPLAYPTYLWFLVEALAERLRFYKNNQTLIP